MLSRLVLGLLAVASLAGCTIWPGETSFGGAFPEEDGVAGLTVTVEDKTGLMTEVVVAPEMAAPPMDDGVSDHPQGLVVTWVGGACDQSVAFVFERDGPGYAISGTTTTTGGACILIGIQRNILLVLEAPVAADTVEFTMGDPTP